VDHPTIQGVVTRDGTNTFDMVKKGILKMSWESSGTNRNDYGLRSQSNQSSKRTCYSIQN
ncbi:MAG: hypothetical protein Q8755_02870, partial [Candidatus Phytoplasma australasiaticum]|nr:hypothetical protein [Candidatus Phytoplasma australasiaticum]